ncbi:unnamed protein product [Larinioides sclopetarius]|uniref:RNase H type-1 domain-containing protein n=1 Tax=Larinioides sclopetarius TaxID=280406 RepID=A0AAV1Z7E2_9ARAC
MTRGRLFVPNTSSVFQAEMVALIEAMRWLSQESLVKCTIHTDSQSSLKALAALQPNSPIAREILNISNTLTTEVTISWVKGHSGVLGNEIADQLARQGTVLWTVLSSSILISLNLTLKRISKNVPLKSGKIGGTSRKRGDGPSSSFLKST